MTLDKKNLKTIAFAAIFGAIGGFINGFLGAGGGIILLWVLKKLNPNKDESAVRDNFGAVVAAVLLLSIVSAISYSHRGQVNTASLAVFALPGIVGGALGALLTDKLNTGILKLAFSVIIVIAGINMVF